MGRAVGRNAASIGFILCFWRKIACYFRCHLLYSLQQPGAANHRCPPRHPHRTPQPPSRTRSARFCWPCWMRCSGMSRGYRRAIRSSAAMPARAPISSAISRCSPPPSPRLRRMTGRRMTGRRRRARPGRAGALTGSSWPAGVRPRGRSRATGGERHGRGARRGRRRDGCRWPGYPAGAGRFRASILLRYRNYVLSRNAPRRASTSSGVSSGR